MKLNNWITLIREELKEPLRVIVYDQSKVVTFFLEEVLETYQIELISVEKFSFAEDSLFQIAVLVVQGGEDFSFLLKKIKETYEEAKVCVILNFLKEEDIGRYFDLGVDEVVFKPFSLNELKARLSKLFKEYYLDKKIKRFLIEDPLTGVYNRRFFEEKIREEAYKALRQKYPLSLMMIDLDNFKWYNDYLGHKEGDALLKLVGETLLHSVRLGVDLVFRYGGDEFVVLLPYTTKEQAEQVAERIKKNWEVYNIPNVKLSIGIAQLQDKKNLEKSIEEVITKADALMYAEKKANKVSV
ncbi:diguanylate cyclase [Thermodesulfobacterium sp. TA1]|uniref:diguanylate cyclase n=1 Tax=Thermodesulfobacterium sp. TA1 TaxID=2234087 RepID=UPI001232508B|nr:diguanylate cyclase [Thermodesulfobacterium sp. TA1]QER41498.1 diguanylate cyclase [Thermodesulfobacterium sp. TA1]